VTAPVVGVLALQGDVREHVSALELAGVRAVPVRRPSELASVQAMVLPGGESTTMGKLSVEFGLLEPLRERVREGMPAFGSCAGMIMLADRVLDGRSDQLTVGGMDMTVRRNAFGRQVQSFEADIQLSGGLDQVGEARAAPFHAVFIRAPWVESTGPEVTVLGTAPAPGAADRIVAVRQGNLLATSFHPELTSDLRVHTYFVDIVRRAQTGGQP
jgi:pyridoxal 5'-phosphate synthase pdxT subunit